MTDEVKRMKNLKSRLLSLTLVIVMMLSMAGTALATESDSDETASSGEGYTVTFKVDEHATIDVYYNKETYEADASADPNETNVTSAVARVKGGTDVDTSGEGQVNFRINVDDGYEIATNEAAPTDNYNSYKSSEDTGVEGVYRITKITGDITVTITTQAVSTDEETENTDDENTDDTADDETDADDGETDDAVAVELDSETVWSYWDEEEDPAGDSSEEGYDRTRWTVSSYDVSSWKTGVCSFGAKNGELKSLSGGLMPVTLLTQYKAGTSYDEGTEENIECFFFRTTVTIEDASAIEQIKGYIYYDDTATIYINGTKVAGYSDDDTITENMVYIDGDAGDCEISITDEEALAALVDGENIIAVEVHNCNATSSDIYFDMQYLQFRTEVAYEDSEEYVNTPDEAQSSVSLNVGIDETERNITWYYNAEGTGTLYLAKESDLVDGAMPSDAAEYTAEGVSTNKEYYYSFQVTIEGLEEDTSYAYQVVNGDVVSEVYTFETSTSDGSFSFALAGDPQLGCSVLATDVENWENTLNIVAENELFEDVDFLLSAGDQVQTADNEDEYDGFLEHEVLSSLTIATVVGNHDSSSSAYSEHFNTTSDETNESSYGSTEAGEDYYYVYEGVLFMVLNSNNTSTAEHQAFMEEAIAATADQDISWRVVTFHHSIYSVASHSLEDSIIQRREELVPVFEELDIDVVLMGHDHVYVRTYIMDGLEVSEDEDYEYDEDGVPVSVTDTDGILYVTANSSSASKFYDIKTSVNFEYAAVMNQDYIANISLCTVTEDSFTITTYETNEMTQVDTFTIYRTEEDEEEETEFVELSGDDRYETMSAIAAEAYGEETCEYAVLATGSSYADALAASALAGALNAPIVLVKDSDPSEAIETLEELEVSYLYVVGGTSAISTDTVSEIQFATGAAVKRLSGSNRYATALKIAKEVQKLSDEEEISDICIIATGSNFADALSASAYAYYADAPIYLVRSDDGISEEVLASIEEGGYTNIIVMGGTAAVSEEAYAQLEEIEGVTVSRMNGENRYETSAMIAEWSVEQGMSYDCAVIATGTNYPDALAGAALAGRNGAVILLASDEKTDAVDLLADSTEEIQTIYFLGGTSAISTALRDYVKAFFAQ